MDESVLRGMARWPNVPAIAGWLRRDRRGSWYLRGARVTHPFSIAFFERNFAGDAQGRWFVQNGPQRVYVDLDGPPLLFHLDGADIIRDQWDRELVILLEALVDEEGHLYLIGGEGPGLAGEDVLFNLASRLVDQQGAPLEEDDLELWLEQQTQDKVFLSWDNRTIPLTPIASEQLPERLGYIAKPTV